MSYKCGTWWSVPARRKSPEGWKDTDRTLWVSWKKFKEWENKKIICKKFKLCVCDELWIMLYDKIRNKPG